MRFIDIILTLAMALMPMLGAVSVQVKIYTKLGFEAVRDIEIASDYGSAHMWLLVKRPEQTPA